MLEMGLCKLKLNSNHKNYRNLSENGNRKVKCYI